MKHKLTSFPLTLLAAAAMSLSFPASAGEAFGGINNASVYVDVAKFQSLTGPTGTMCGFRLTGAGGYYSNECDNGTSSNTYYAPFELPEGARVTNVYVHYYDNDAVGTFTHQVLKLDTNWNGGGTPATDFTFGGTGITSTDSTEYQMASDTPSPLLVYDTYDNTTARHAMYALRISMPTSTAVRYRGSWILYNRQIAPAPASASFSDVPTTHQFFNQVEQLTKSGITAGCGGGNYCPNASVTRGQMAVFLSKALGLHWDFGTNPAP